MNERELRLRTDVREIELLHELAEEDTGNAQTSDTMQEVVMK